MAELERSDSGQSLPELDLEQSVDLDSVEPLAATRSDGITLTFEDLCYTVENQIGGPLRKKSIKRQILFNVSGQVRPGQMLAVMGATGSGKTTLLNVLAGRVRKNVTGSVLVNGSPLSKQMKRKTAFVMQNDVFYSDLTVRETLTLTAYLRLPSQLTRAEKRQKVDDMLHSLGLTKAADTIVGATFPFKRGISGGEKKRLNIGNELLTDPALLMVDEPTAGLDSSTAWVVLKLLKQLALGGRTIVCTIHQPSSRMYLLFDDLMLLSDGHVMYYGPAKDATAYFSKIAPACPSYYNPADYLLQLAVTEKDPDGTLMKDRLVGHYEKEVYPNLQIEKVDPSTKTPLFVKGEAKWPSSFIEQFVLLGWRSFRQKRGYIFQWLTFGQIIAITIIVSLIWFQRDTDVDSIDDRFGLIFFCSVYWSIYPMFRVLTSFPSERGVLSRERSTGTYRLSAFYFSKQVAETPLDLVLPTLYCVVVYWATGLNPEPAKFFVFLITIMLDVAIAFSIGFMIASAIVDVQKAIVVAATFFLSSMLLGGFYIDEEQIPDWLAWAQYLSPIRFVFEILLINEFDGEDFDGIAGSDVLDERVMSSLSVFVPFTCNRMLTLTSSILTTSFYSVDFL